jgi:hypothetical protein
LQLNLDFSKPLSINSGKKTERLPIACSESFKKALNLISDTTGITVAELLYRYAVDGIKNDFGTIFMTEPHLSKTLDQIIKENR